MLFSRLYDFFFQGVPMTSLRFLFDGKRINDDETPKQVNIKTSFVNVFFNFTALIIYRTII